MRLRPELVQLKGKTEKMVIQHISRITEQKVPSDKGRRVLV